MSENPYPTKLSAGIVFWAGVHRLLSPIMLESQEMALAYAPEMLKRGNIEPIEFFATLLIKLQMLGIEHGEPIYHTKAKELHTHLCKVIHQFARNTACAIADKYDPSISKEWDEGGHDDWMVVWGVAKLLAKE